MGDNPFRTLPSVQKVLDLPAIAALTKEHSHELIVAAVRIELDDLRRRVGAGEAIDGDAGAEALARRVAERLGHELQPKLRRVINATGIILHTNLGRSPLAEEAARAAYEAARGYLNLELNLE